MKRRTLAALALCLALITLSGGAQAALLGVQIPHTPEPTPEETAAPAAQAATLSVSTQPREATPGEADWLGREITMEERDAAGLGERILMRGMEGEDVALMQKRLYQLGYYLDEIDGVFGLRTRTAVYAFQRANKLEKIDGKVGPETIRMMFRADVVIKPTPTPTPTPAPSPMPTPTPEEFVIENGVLTAYNGTAVDVVVPDEVTAIGEKAFYRCSKIVSVSLPYGVTSIGDYAFYGCYDLADIDIPESVTSIGSRAFSYCYDLTEVYLPDSVEVLGTYVFNGCNQLASVRLPLYIAKLPNGTFSSCDALTKITLPGTVTSFPTTNPFPNTTTVRCYQNSYAEVWACNHGYICEYIDNACTTNFTLPASLTAIEDEAFIGLAAEQIVIPDGVTSIGEYAFMDCSELMQLHIPQSVTEIADTAFDGAVELAIYTSPDAPAYQIAKEYGIPVVFLAE